MGSRDFKRLREWARHKSKHAMYSLHNLWIIPYAFAVSLPYFFKDVWDALDHLYSNMQIESSFLHNTRLARVER